MMTGLLNKVIPGHCIMAGDDVLWCVWSRLLQLPDEVFGLCVTEFLGTF